jgi:hypothetical protein
MRALVYTAPGMVEMQERPRPELRAGQEEIAIDACAVLISRDFLVTARCESRRWFSAMSW